MIAPRSVALLLEELCELARTRAGEPSQPLVHLHRQLALIHTAIADQLELRQPALAPAANDGGQSTKRKPANRRGPRIPSLKLLEADGLSDTDRAAAERAANRRGWLKNGGTR